MDGAIGAAGCWWVERRSGGKETMGRVFHVGRGITDRLAGKGLRIDEVQVQETRLKCRKLGFRVFWVFCSVVPCYENGVAKVRGRLREGGRYSRAVTCTESWTEMNSAA